MMVLAHPSAEEEVSMNTVTTIGIDLAKNVFSICGVNAAGRVMSRQDLQRDAFALWLAHVPAGTVIAMEACTGAHHWGRRCLEYGLVPRLMAAQFVAPFRKNRTAKNDHNDAEAIATAARQGNMRFVPVKGKRAAKTSRQGYARSGSKVSMSRSFVVGRRVSTSVSHACGSSPLALAVASKPMIAAARWPARSAPTNIQFRLPRAIGRIAFSIGLLSIG
jgi:hypothetical protein